MSRKLLNTGIYCFQNKINGKRYIGQAHNVERRIYEHEYHLKRGSDKCVALQNAVNKYGLENFESFVIENCPREDMSKREIYWISNFKSNNRKYGYNLSNGGESGLFGYKHSPEMGRKVSATKKAMGWKMPEEVKKKISNATKGIPKSEETKKKMSSNHSRFWLGKKMPLEMIENLIKSHKNHAENFYGKKKGGASSKYFGVGKLVQKGHVYWTVNMKAHGKRTHIGMRKDEIEAARLYDAYVTENNLPNPLNFPTEAHEV